MQAKLLEGRRRNARQKAEGPTRIDLHVGSRVRERRVSLGLSQERLGASLGLTFQQVQKYERGANRIGAGRLFEIARILEVPVAFFFDGFEDDGLPQSPVTTAKRSTTAGGARDLVEAYEQIDNPLVRRRIVQLVEALAGAVTGDEHDPDVRPG